MNTIVRVERAALAHLGGDDLIELVVHLIHRPVSLHMNPAVVTQPLVVAPHL